MAVISRWNSTERVYRVLPSFLELFFDNVLLVDPQPGLLVAVVYLVLPSCSRCGLTKVEEDPRFLYRAMWLAAFCWGAIRRAANNRIRRHGNAAAQKRNQNRRCESDRPINVDHKSQSTRHKKSSRGHHYVEALAVQAIGETRCRDAHWLTMTSLGIQQPMTTRYSCIQHIEFSRHPIE